VGRQGVDLEPPGFERLIRQLRGADRIRHVRDHLDRTPQPGGAGELECVAAKGQGVGDASRIERRDAELGEQALRRARQGRGLAGGVVAHEGNHAAARAASDPVAVADRIGGPVDAGRLAVPDPEHAVVARVRQVVGELAAPYRGRRELLVEARDVEDGFIHGHLAESGHLAVEARQGRALVSGDHRGRVQPRPPVSAPLLEQHANERLHACEEDPTRIEQVLV
jgi:hypothetical protein